MNVTIFNNQLYLGDNELVFFTKFYLLDDAFFQAAYEAGYKALLSDFYNMVDFEQKTKLDFDALITDGNTGPLITVFDNILNKLRVNGDIATYALASALLQRDNRKDIVAVINSNMPGKAALEKHFIMLQNAVRNGGFYPVSLVSAADMAGEWLSTKESGQLRINYNMTDYMPVGNQLRLRIRRKDDAYYTFECFTQVVDYKYPSATQYICVMSRLIKIEDGYIHYFWEENKELMCKRPVYNYMVNTVAIQIYDMEFSFKRVDTSILKN